MSKVFKNCPIQGFGGENIKIPQQKKGSNEVEVVDAKLTEILTIILNDAPLRTQDDSIQGFRLAEAIEAARDKKTIEIEDGVHDWLKPIAEQLTPMLFRINGNIVYKHICEGFDKPEGKDIKGE